MIRIIFRCDASLSIGSGHVMRCRNLARELHRRGSEIIFLCRYQRGDLIKLLQQEFPVIVLPEQPATNCKGLVGRELYSAWLGCGQEHDASQCLEGLAKAGINSANWLVVDHYGLDASWEEQMITCLTSHAPPQLLVIDDLADRLHQADLLLDQNFFGEVGEQRYRGLVPLQCRQLLGPKYALLGMEYAQLAPHVPPRRELKRLLIFFGGRDEANLTGHALEALSHPLLADLAVDVVHGHQNLHRNSLSVQVARRPYTTEHGPMASLAGLIARADLAIGASGATTWERFSLGCPCITTIIAENQRELACFLNTRGLIYLINEGTPDYASSLVNAVRYLSQPKILLSRSKQLPSLCDGNGAAKIAKSIYSW